MPFVITNRCHGTCDTACVDVCPADCIKGPVSVDELRSMAAEERKRANATMQLYIDPDHCVDCAACMPECPVGAIFPDDELPPGEEDAARLNATFFAPKIR